MRLISVNVGTPRTVFWRGKQVSTSIFKSPVAGPVMARPHNLEGDRQADLTVHGGADKAIYVYPSEHYIFWHSELPGVDLPWGMFGENFTTEGLLEADVHIGDHLRVGAAEVMVTEPRMPCYKLGLKFGRADMVKRFLASRRTGFYLAIVQLGLVAAGDEIEVVYRDPHGVGVGELTRIYAGDRGDAMAIRRILQVESLPESWRSFLERR
ncbi:MAG TPA: MOSC domain-containing protein [Roseiflexaceae bacterium]|nr:MOSC domain-containing protein [Roseiflexaceae bacterium]